MAVVDDILGSVPTAAPHRHRRRRSGRPGPRGQRLGAVRAAYRGWRRRRSAQGKRSKVAVGLLALLVLLLSTFAWALATVFAAPAPGTRLSLDQLTACPSRAGSPATLLDADDRLIGRLSSRGPRRQPPRPSRSPAREPRRSTSPQAARSTPTSPRAGRSPLTSTGRCRPVGRRSRSTSRPSSSNSGWSRRSCCPLLVLATVFAILLSPGGARRRHRRHRRLLHRPRRPGQEGGRDLSRLRQRRWRGRGRHRTAGGRRLPARPHEVRGHGRCTTQGAAAVRPARAAARRCSPRRSPARRACRSSPSPEPSSSRRWSASARPACVTSSSACGPLLRRSSSSTSSMRLAASAAPVVAAAAPMNASRPSTSCSWRWMASTPPRASSSSAPPTGPDILDPALRRPGRFDRHITIERPDPEGRLEDPADPRDAASPSRTTSTCSGSPSGHRASPAPTWPTSSTRPRCSPSATRGRSSRPVTSARRSGACSKGPSARATCCPTPRRTAPRTTRPGTSWCLARPGSTAAAAAGVDPGRRPRDRDHRAQGRRRGAGPHREPAARPAGRPPGRPGGRAGRLRRHARPVSSATSRRPPPWPATWWRATAWPSGLEFTRLLGPDSSAYLGGETPWGDIAEDTKAAADTAIRGLLREAADSRSQLLEQQRAGARPRGRRAASSTRRWRACPCSPCSTGPGRPWSRRPATSRPARRTLMLRRARLVRRPGPRGQCRRRFRAAQRRRRRPPPADLAAPSRTSATAGSARRRPTRLASRRPA